MMKLFCAAVAVCVLVSGCGPQAPTASDTGASAPVSSPAPVVKVEPLVLTPEVPDVGPLGPSAAPSLACPAVPSVAASQPAAVPTTSASSPASK